MYKKTHKQYMFTHITLSKSLLISGGTQDLIEQNQPRLPILFDQLGRTPDHLDPNFIR